VDRRGQRSQARALYPGLRPAAYAGISLFDLGGHHLQAAVEDLGDELAALREGQADVRLHQVGGVDAAVACEAAADEDAALARCRRLFALDVDPAAVLDGLGSDPLLGPQVRIGRDRGRPVESALAPHVTITAHPSSILRAREASERGEAMAHFIDDLQEVARWLRAGA